MGIVSLLEAIPFENKRYYEYLASCYFNGRFRHPSNFPGRIAYSESLYGRYAYDLAQLIIRHYESLSSPSRFVLLEFGGAEGIVLASILNVLKSERIYDALEVYLVDFAESYRPHQEINLREHREKVRLFLNPFNMLPIQADFIILNEFLDDLEAVGLYEWEKNTYFITAFDDSNKEIILVPSTKLPEDFRKLGEYSNRFSLSPPFIAYLGIEGFFKEASLLLKKGGLLYVMDYMTDFPGCQFCPPLILIDDRIKANGEELVNITSILSENQLRAIASLSNFEEIGSENVRSNSIFYVRTYRRVLFRKI